MSLHPCLMFGYRCVVYEELLHKNDLYSNQISLKIKLGAYSVAVLIGLV